MSSARIMRDPPPETADSSNTEPGLEPREEAEYRRRRNPVRVRQQRGWAHSWRHGWKPALVAAIAIVLTAGLYALVFASSWFVLQGSDQITVVGAHQTDARRVLAPFSADLGRNTFFIPLTARRREVEQIPWVRQAAILRIWPARLEVKITERTPVAFARAGNQLDLIDGNGVLLERPPQGHFDFPILTGLVGIAAPNPNAARWLSRRQTQVSQWLEFEKATASLGASQDISEGNLNDPGNLRVRAGVSRNRSVLVDLGDRNFEPRFQLFLSQISAWRQKYPNLISVDLRFDGQAIVDPGPAATLPAPAPSHRSPGARR